MDARTNGEADGWTDGRPDGRPDGWEQGKGGGRLIRDEPIEITINSK